jgi:hypothetical protein
MSDHYNLETMDLGENDLRSMIDELEKKVLVDLRKRQARARRMGRNAARTLDVDGSMKLSDLAKRYGVCCDILEILRQYLLEHLHQPLTRRNMRSRACRRR